MTYKRCNRTGIKILTFGLKCNRRKEYCLLILKNKTKGKDKISDWNFRTLKTTFPRSEFTSNQAHNNTKFLNWNPKFLRLLANTKTTFNPWVESALKQIFQCHQWNSSTMKRQNPIKISWILIITNTVKINKTIFLSLLLER